MACRPKNKKNTLQRKNNIAIFVAAAAWRAKPCEIFIANFIANFIAAFIATFDENRLKPNRGKGL